MVACSGGNQGSTSKGGKLIFTTGGDTGTANVSLIDAIKVALTKYYNVANVYIGVDQSDVTVNGYIRIEYVR